MNKKCANPDCNNVIDGISKRIYCSKKCNAHCYYLRNKKKIIEYGRIYKIKNPEKRKLQERKNNMNYRARDRKSYNAKVMKNYYKNKSKWHSRVSTYNMMTGYKDCKKYNPLKKECSICKSERDIEIHHDIYPTKRIDIIKAIDNGEIYYLCKKCHGRTHGL